MGDLQPLSNHVAHDKFELVLVGFEVLSFVGTIVET